MGCPRCKHEEPGSVRRIAGVASAVAPGALLAVMPKCPGCVAGYVALATGVGVSVSVASYLKMGAIAMCVLWLALVGASVVRRLAR